MDQFPPEVQATLMRVFVDDTAARLERVRADLGLRNLTQVGREAHAIKAGSLQIGETVIAEHSERLRQATIAGDDLAAQRHLSDLLAAFHALTSGRPD